MIKVRDGDLDKLGLLFERYKKPLYGFFYGFTRERDLSEDLVQNTFLRILKYRHLFRGEGDFRAWLFHIARNVRHDHHRKDKTSKQDDVENWKDRLGNHENRSVEWVRADEHEMLSLALARLPEDKREILLLSKFQENKYEVIGQMLGCTESAVKVKVFRAMQELKTVYQQLEKIM